MSGVLFASPLSVAAIAASRGAGADRLLTDDPREAFVDTAAGSVVTFTVDLGGVRPVDLVFVGFTNAAAGASWAITGGLAAANEQVLQAATAFPIPGGAAGRVHGLALLAVPVSVRHLAISITQPAGVAPLTAGVLAIAEATVPEWGQEWGGGRGVTDLAPKTRLAGGGFGIGEGIRVANWTATLGDLTDADLADLWSLMLAHGESAPLLLIEQPTRDAGLASRMHWGVFDRIEPYERLSAGRTRWGVKFQDWI